MPAIKDVKYGGISSSAVEAKTGRGWNEWLKVLDKAGAKKWSHKEIAEYLHEQCKCPPWWSQMVTVGYEQARGLREKNETTSGFSASVSKTINVPIGKLFDAWNNAKLLAEWFRDAAKIEVRKATKDKTLRVTGANGNTGVEIYFWDKGADKSQVVVQERKLTGAADVAKVKKYWAAALDALKDHLDNKVSAKRKRPRNQ